MFSNKRYVSGIQDGPVILAFKFMQKEELERRGKTVYTHRKLQEYYKVADRYSKIKDLPT